MRRLKHFLLLSACTLVLAACAPKPGKPETKIIRLNRSVTHLVVNGPYRVKVYGNAKSSQIKIEGYPSVIRHIHVTTCKNKVRISGFQPQGYLVKVYLRYLRGVHVDGVSQLTIDAKHHGHFNLTAKNTGTIQILGEPTVPVMVLDNTHSFSHRGIFLRKLTHKGSGNLYLTDVRGHAVEIHAYGPGSVSLSGPFKVRKVVHRGNGTLNLTGIRGDDLTMDLKGNAHYHFSGRVRKLSLNIGNKIRVNARHLQVYDAYLKTMDYAVLRILVTHRIFAEAKDASRIEYYGPPKYKYLHAYGCSAILPMSNA